jgi:hypothetical protein
VVTIETTPAEQRHRLESGGGETHGRPRFTVGNIFLYNLMNILFDIVL